MVRRAVALVLLQILMRAHADPHFKKTVAGLERGVAVMGDLLFPEPAPRQATDCHVHLAGLGRTGTTSLVAAMRQLGYHVLHDDETGQEADLFKALYADPASTTDKLTEFHSQLGARGFNASAYGFLYFDWAAKQPSSKIILTVRDPDTWAASWQSITHLYDLMQEVRLSDLTYIQLIHSCANTLESSCVHFCVRLTVLFLCAAAIHLDSSLD
jgi:hypothetical protein